MVCLVSIDALTFTTHVISDTADIEEEEFSIINQKELSIVRKAFQSTDHMLIGIHGFGLFIKVARWNHEQRTLEESQNVREKTRCLVSSVVIFLKYLPVHTNKDFY